MTNQEQFLSVLRLYLRDFNEDIGGFGVLDFCIGVGMDRVLWTVYDKEYQHFVRIEGYSTGKYTAIRNTIDVFKLLTKSGLRGITIQKDFENNYKRLAILIKKEFEKYPHIKFIS